jgi:hypothetical protein
MHENPGKGSEGRIGNMRSRGRAQGLPERAERGNRMVADDALQPCGKFKENNWCGVQKFASFSLRILEANFWT